jgi:hypothetical protein
MTDLLALADRVERETAGSRELDAEILKVTNTNVIAIYRGLPGYATEFVQEHGLQAPTARTIDVPHYTSSLDAAMTLVPVSFELSEISRNISWEDFQPERDWCVTLSEHDADGNYKSDVSAPGDTFALALTAAALRAIHFTPQHSACEMCDALSLPMCKEIAKFIMQFPHFKEIEAIAIANAIERKFNLRALSVSALSTREIQS